MDKEANLFENLARASEGGARVIWLLVATRNESHSASLVAKIEAVNVKNQELEDSTPAGEEEEELGGLLDGRVIKGRRQEGRGR